MNIKNLGEDGEDESTGGKIRGKSHKK